MENFHTFATLDEALPVETLPYRMLTTKWMSEALQLIGAAALFSKDDPRRHHSSQVARLVVDAINDYMDQPFIRTPYQKVLLR